MQEIEITIGRLLRVVWLLLWRAVLGGAVLGGTHEHIVLVNSIVGLVVGAIWWVAVVKMALAKHYKDFQHSADRPLTRNAEAA